MKNLLITLAALILVLGCKKERVKYLSDDIKKNYSYKPGSYWIYRDSATGREDSCYVEAYYFNTVKASSITRDPTQMEIMYVYFIQVQKDSSKKDSIKRQIFFKENIMRIDEFEFSFPISKNYAQVSNGYFGGYTQFYANYIVGSIPYINVSNINYQSPNTTNYRNYWISESNGFIKIREYLDTTEFVWELQRWKVIK